MTQQTLWQPTRASVYHDGVTGTLYTLGYANVRTAPALAALLAGKSEVVADIRLSRWSSGFRDFSMKVEEAVVGTGLEYLWVKGLGNAEHKTGGMRLADPTSIVEVLNHLHNGRSVAIMCGCAKVEECHRRFVALLAQRLIPDLEVIDL